jgi:hypothetical protein
MTDIEDLLRRSLARHADHAPYGDGIPAAVRRRGRRVALTGVASAVLVIVAAGTALGVADLNNSAGGSSVAHSPGQFGPTRVVSFHGIEVSVPRAWSTNQAACQVAERSTVVIDSAGADDNCGPGFHQRHGISDIRLDPTGAGNGVTDGAFARAVSRGGVTELVGTQPNPSGPHRTLVVIPSSHVTVTVDTADALLRQRIIDSIHAAATSPEGCAMSVSKYGPEGRWFDQDTTSRGPLRSLIPTTPSSMTLCQYDADGGLSESVALDPDAAAGVAADLNRLNGGLRRIDQQSCLNALGSRAFVVLSHYADGSTGTVRVIDGCGTYALTNGVRSGSLTTRQMSRFLDLLNDDEGSD